MRAHTITATRLALLLSLLALGAPGLVVDAQANTGRYTQGDAEAMLNTYPPGTNIFERLDGAAGLDIRPFQEFYGDVPYCVEDWHVLALLVSDGEYAVEEFNVVNTQDDALAFLNGVDSEFFLDRQPVEVVRTPIKPYLSADADFFLELFLREEFGDEATITIGSQWALQWGRVLAPDELSVGKHTLRVIVTDPEQGVLSDDSLTFTVYPPESEACTL
jgi:hypothetical protein